VQTHGYFAVEGRRVVNPGSVVMLDDDQAAEFIKRGLGSAHPGPESDAPAPEVERPGMDARPSRAEQAVAAPQQRRTV
jgi:hypothetical protein